MASRRGKQVGYGVFYLAVFAAVIACVFFIGRLLFPPPPVVPPCTQACMPTSTAPLVASPVQAFVSTPGHYTFLVPVSNTSTDYAAQYFAYSLNLYDASGTVLQSVPGTSFIYAGETKYLVLPNITVGTAFVHSGLAISNAYWASSSSLGVKPQFSVENVQVGASTSTVSVSGQITNSNISSYQYVYVDAIFTGPDGAPVGATQTVLNNVTPQETVSFTVSYPQTGGINPAIPPQVLVYALK